MTDQSEREPAMTSLCGRLADRVPTSGSKILWKSLENCGNLVEKPLLCRRFRRPGRLASSAMGEIGGQSADAIARNLTAAFDAPVRPARPQRLC